MLTWKGREKKAWITRLYDGWLGWDLWQIARSEPASLSGEKQAPAERAVCDLLHSMRGAEAEQPCDCKRS